MNRDNGSVTVRGVEYILEQQAYLDRNCRGEAAYFASAKRADLWDSDDAGEYMVEWEIVNPDCDNADESCEWDSPLQVRKI